MRETVWLLLPERNIGAFLRWALLRLAVMAIIVFVYVSHLLPDWSWSTATLVAIFLIATLVAASLFRLFGFVSGDGGVDSLRSIIAKPKNREILSWIGGGVIVVAIGVWAVVAYVWPAH
jgi:hypothetical protein